MVADYIGSIHHSIEVTEEQMLDAIQNTVKMIESYDTIRQVLLRYYCVNILKKIQILLLLMMKLLVLIYIYTFDDESFRNETIRLKDLHYFDVLRCDKSAPGVD